MFNTVNGFLKLRRALSHSHLAANLDSSPSASQLLESPSPVSFLGFPRDHLTKDPPGLLQLPLLEVQLGKGHLIGSNVSLQRQGFLGQLDPFIQVRFFLQVQQSQAVIRIGKARLGFDDLLMLLDSIIDPAHPCVKPPLVAASPLPPTGRWPKAPG